MFNQISVFNPILKLLSLSLVMTAGVMVGVTCNLDNLERMKDVTARPSVIRVKFVAKKEIQSLLRMLGLFGS